MRLLVNMDMRILGCFGLDVKSYEISGNVKENSRMTVRVKEKRGSYSRKAIVVAKSDDWSSPGILLWFFNDPPTLYQISKHPFSFQTFVNMGQVDKNVFVRLNGKGIFKTENC